MSALPARQPDDSIPARMSAWLPATAEETWRLEVGLAILLAVSIFASGVFGYLLWLATSHRGALEKAAADAELATTRAELGQTRAAAEELRQRIAPRDVTPQQRTTMLRILREGPIGDVVVLHGSDAEAHVFAARLGSILSEAGWAVKQEGGISIGAAFDFSIQMQDAAAPPPRAVTLRRAIEEAFGRPVRLREQKSMGVDTVILDVPTKPVR